MAKKAAISTIKPTQKNTNETPEGTFVFGKENYKWTIISFAVVVLGFALMYGNTNIYDFRKIVLAPIVVLSGFGLGFYAIFKK